MRQRSEMVEPLSTWYVRGPWISASDSTTFNTTSFATAPRDVDTYTRPHCASHKLKIKLRGSSAMRTFSEISMILQHKYFAHHQYLQCHELWMNFLFKKDCVHIFFVGSMSQVFIRVDFLEIPSPSGYYLCRCAPSFAWIFLDFFSSFVGTSDADRDSLFSHQRAIWDNCFSRSRLLRPISSMGFLRSGRRK